MKIKGIKLIFALLIILCSVTIVFFGHSVGYIIPSVILSFIIIAYFFVMAEIKEQSIKLLCLLAALTAISVSLRTIFYLLPHFKPVAAVVIITAIYLGRNNGFICGALSALISNFIFGQGPWTPFQMLCFGLIGFFAGLLANQLKKNRIILMLFGIASGIFYSFIMDLSSILWMSQDFSFSKVMTLVFSSLPVTAVYCVSNAVFLILLTKVIGKKLELIKNKYSI